MKKFSITVLCLLNCLLITSCTGSREQRSALYGNTAEALSRREAYPETTEEKTSDKDLPGEEEESLDSGSCMEEEKTAEESSLPDTVSSEEDEEEEESLRTGARTEKEKMVEAFLLLDWTEHDVLLGHTIQPGDSAACWEFRIADTDFDGKQEMLVSFLANHCGSNSLYVYRQEGTSAFCCLEMIATPEKYMITDTNYKEISPYMEIDLVDVYVNKEKNYRYLSMDCSSVGGNDDVVLYETEFAENLTQTEIARISRRYDIETSQNEYFFLGKKVESGEKLRNLIDVYMDGYEKQELDYTRLNKTFSRDIVALSAEEQKQELEELYEAIREWAGKQ